MVTENKEYTDGCDWYVGDWYYDEQERDNVIIWSFLSIRSNLVGHKNNHVL